MNAITPGVVGDWKMEVAAYVDGEDPTAWTAVMGIQELTPPQTEKTLENSSEFDGTHWTAQTSTSIGWTAEATVKVPRATLTADPGQDILRSAARGVAETGQVHVRFSKRGTDPQSGDQGVADVQFYESGGAKTALTLAALTLTGVGELVEFTEPAV